jgi:hypothetical protein
LRPFRAVAEKGDVAPGRCPGLCYRCPFGASTGRRSTAVRGIRSGCCRNIALAGPSKAPAGRDTSDQGSALAAQPRMPLEHSRIHSCGCGRKSVADLKATQDRRWGQGFHLRALCAFARGVPCFTSPRCQRGQETATASEGGCVLPVPGRHPSVERHENGATHARRDGEVAGKALP